jgi:hypothetical protein
MKTKDVKDIKKGETILTTIRSVNGDKLQIEIAEIVDNQSINVAAMLNKGDDRFKNAVKVRRAWQSATAEGLKDLLNIDVADLNFETVDDKEIATLNMLNPTIAGERLHVQINDSLTKSFDKQEAKQITTKEGVFFLTKDGGFIYQTTKIVAEEPKHVIITSNGRMAKEEAKATTRVNAMQLNA